MRKPLNALVNLNLVVAGAAVLLLVATERALGLEPDGRLRLLAFCATFVVYALDRLAGVSPEDSINLPDRTAFVQRHRRGLLATSGLAALACLGLTAYLEPRTLLLLAGCGALTLAYVLPVPGLGNRLKEIPLAKALLIGLLWSAGATLVPLAQLGQPPDTLAWLIYAHTALAVWSAALVFDLRDRRGDLATGTESLAGRLGPRRTLWLCRGLLLLALPLLPLAGQFGLERIPMIGLAAMDGMLLALLSRTPPEGESLYYGLWVDGSLAVPGLVALLF